MTLPRPVQEGSHSQFRIDRFLHSADDLFGGRTRIGGVPGYRAMKRLISAFAILLGCAPAGWATAPIALTSLRAIHTLTNEQARQALPVAFQATVTYFRSYERSLFVQEGDVAIYVAATTNADLVPGDRVLIKGTLRPSFHPYVLSSDITVLNHGAPLNPLPVSYHDLLNEQLDCRLVIVHAVVRSADLILSSYRLTTSLQLLSGGGDIETVVDSDDAEAIKKLPDADVEVTGTVSGKFDGKMQRVGFVIHSSSLGNIKVLKYAGTDPWSLPITPMDQIFTGFRVRDSTPRFHVQGIITYYQPGSAVVLQDGSRSLWISTQTRSPLKVDDLADATGFPDVHSGFLALTRSEIQDRHIQAPINPLPVTWEQLASSGNIFDLVSIEGDVVTEVREALQDEYVLASDGRLFTAVYRHPATSGRFPLPPMKLVPLGSRVRATGVCIPENSNPFDYDRAFNILLRSFADITVIAKPSWLNIQNLTRIVIVLLLVVIGAGAWGWALMRKIHRQTTAMAARTEAEASLERRRSSILENINGATPLAEIIEQITDIVSCKLDGAPCCCQIADGARLGVCPPDGENLRIVQMNIRGRSGPLLGSFIAGLRPLSKPSVLETEALAVGAGLATLAIETRRLYSDLLRRSEFDLLTDIQNRFSFDKRLDAQIEETRLNAGVFGLIYVDLDEFKQVNDECGHQVGDLYLQAVATRMKHQVRSVDLLARLGGDEFAVLVPEVRKRADVEEIALRIERSFDEPVAVAEYVLHASASVGIAIYPEDSLTKDGLLNAADSAMYKTKNTKKQIARMLAGSPDPHSTLKSDA